MAIVAKTIPYEVLIRFSEGAEHQKNEVGAFEGAHYIERVRLFDDETGEIVGTPKGEENDKPKDLPKDKVAEYLGAPFVAFEAQNRELQGKLDATVAAADEAAKLAAEDIASRDARISEQDAAIGELNARIADLTRLGAAVVAIQD